MNHVERFRAVMGFQPVDRLPRWEWAMWWDKTIERWHGEGLPSDLNDTFEIGRHFGLDPYKQFWFYTIGDRGGSSEPPIPGSVTGIDSYREIKPRLYPDASGEIEEMRPWMAKQGKGEAVVWITLEGFFWFPRSLMGIEPHLFSFYDQTELIHAINFDLAEYHIRLLRSVARVGAPVFLTFAEDMCYNHGPMISRTMFDDFLAPYYRKVVPVLRELGIIPIVDSDGDVTRMVPWFESVGIEGFLPLERNAGVDGTKLREMHPRLRIIGHYDKMVMNRGKAAMRAEFERLKPVMAGGGYIPSVDHQTHPGVSLGEYRNYLGLLNEYTAITGQPAG